MNDKTLSIEREWRQMSQQQTCAGAVIGAIAAVALFKSLSMLMKLSGFLWDKPLYLGSFRYLPLDTLSSRFLSVSNSLTSASHFWALPGFCSVQI